MTNGSALDAVVLDVGGVLVDWDPRYLFGRLIEDERQREWFLAHVCSPEWNRRQDEGRCWADAVAAAVAQYPDYEGWIRAYDERWLETIAGLYEDTVEVLEELVRSGMPTYALTNFSAEKWAVARGHYAALRHFDGAVVSGEEHVAKPDTEIYRTLVQRFTVAPGRTFFTDDLQRNVDAARELGFDAELFTDAATLRRQLVDRGVLAAHT